MTGVDVCQLGRYEQWRRAANLQPSWMDDLDLRHHLVDGLDDDLRLVDVDSMPGLLGGDQLAAGRQCRHLCLEIVVDLVYQLGQFGHHLPGWDAVANDDHGQLSKEIHLHSPDLRMAVEDRQAFGDGCFMGLAAHHP
jgi:hypothetical protein